MATADVLKPDFASRRKHFIFTDDHEQLRDSIRRFAIKELQPHAEEWEETTFPDWVFERMGELGFLGLDKPVEYGGQGGDYYTTLVLAEELVHAHCGGLGMGIAVQTDMTIPPILKFGTEEQKQEWAVPAIAGRKILCLGITEPDAGSDVAGIKTRAVRDGDEYVINGSKTFITNGHRAHAIVLVTKTDARRRLRRVHAVPGADGLAGRDPREAPAEARHARLRHRAARVRGRPRAGVGRPRPGREGLLPHHVELQGERLIGAAGSVAGAQHVFDRTLEYAKERTAFGRPIGRFQAIRHKFAEMATKIETARQMVYTTAWRFQNGEYPVREITMAKLYAARIAVEVADECIQIHGGNGYMKEYGIERSWRDLRLNRIGAGSDEIMLEVIGRSYGL